MVTQELGIASYRRKSPLSLLYVQVLIAIIAGGLLGYYAPHYANAEWAKALGDGFIRLIKMVVGPIVFCTLVAGISQIQDAKRVGRVGLKALLYFEVVSTLALALGLIVANLLKPGAGLGTATDASAVAKFASQAHSQSITHYLLNIIPESAVSAFGSGDLLQILLFSLLFGFAVSALGDRAKLVKDFVDQASSVMFKIIGFIVQVAPIAAFGAMAYTVGKYGPAALTSLLKLIAVFYLTAFVFVFFVLGAIARWAGFSIVRFLAYLKEELLVVLGASSSEAALPQLMEKLQRLGCSKHIVSLVVPTGYSFNLDGTNIYMTLATLFIAQTMGVELTLVQQLTIVGIAMLTSKGASGVAGAGFVTLAATLTVIDPALLPGMAILLGIDKFMSECRAITNFIGNGVAAIVVAKWEGDIDPAKLAVIAPSA